MTGLSDAERRSGATGGGATRDPLTVTIREAQRLSGLSRTTLHRLARQRAANGQDRQADADRFASLRALLTPPEFHHLRKRFARRLRKTYRHDLRLGQRQGMELRCAQGRRTIADANRQIAKRCQELGIPKAFQPRISLVVRPQRERCAKPAHGIAAHGEDADRCRSNMPPRSRSKWSRSKRRLRFLSNGMSSPSAIEFLIH